MPFPNYWSLADFTLQIFPTLKLKRCIEHGKDQFDRKPGILFESHTFGPLVIDSDRGTIRI